jgi:hypothetical protein
MFDKIKNFFKKTELREPAYTEPKKTRKPKQSGSKLTEKERATAAGEPYIAVVKVNVDPDNINAGEFSLDWNPKFAANLARAGYQAKPGESEDVIVDRWFQTVCRNIALEVYEQNAADPDFREADALREELRHIRSRDLGNGRSEVS